MSVQYIIQTNVDIRIDVTYQRFGRETLQGLASRVTAGFTDWETGKPRAWCSQLARTPLGLSENVREV